MPDRVEREIEEILSKLEGKDPQPSSSQPEPARQPIPLRPRRKPSMATRIAGALPTVPAITPATLLFTGAGVMIAGLILAAFVDALIWVAFAGVVIFLGAFLWAFLRRTTPGQAGPAQSPKGVFWRDRYIEYGPSNRGTGSIERFKRIFRRR